MTFKSSKAYIAKSLFKGVIFWILFNIITGFLTGDSSLSDNYFILFLILFYISFLASYKIKVDRGHITTYQVGMVTNNINLYKASEVLNEKDRVTVIYPDDSRFHVKYGGFSEEVQRRVLELTIPMSGDRPCVSADVIAQHKKDQVNKRVAGNIQNIIGGFTLTALGLVGLFTGIIYLPSGRHGYIYLDKEPTYFYTFLVFLLVYGGCSLLLGLIGRYRHKISKGES